MNKPGIRLKNLVIYGLLLGLAQAGLARFSVAQMVVQPEQMRVPEGFVAELVYAIPDGEGSWVSICNEIGGRMIASDQYGFLYRISPSGVVADAAGNKIAETKIEKIELKIGFAQGLLYAFDSLYVVAHPSNEFQTPAGLFRVRDTNGDDQYDQVELLRRFEGGGEHGPHAVILSPDGRSLYVCAGNHTQLPKLDKTRMVERWDEDQLTTRFPDANGHAVGCMAPGGWICKVDPDGSNFELISAGYRNQYDIAFDPNGELFTYDADMEWDIGLPWYRPTRVCHATSGSEFGWRHGSGKWHEGYWDSLPGTFDIGPGSPTGVVFGTGSRFPSRFQNALFISDWSYGIIYAVHLIPNGASYQAEVERFVAAPALPVTDLVINSVDGAMYFLIGGRRTRSALYRVSYQGDESTATSSYPVLTNAARQRRLLETWHSPEATPDFGLIWKSLTSDDRFLRFAARVALEWQPAERWIAELNQQTDPNAILEGTLALARCADPGLQSQTVQILNQLDWQELTPEQQAAVCRNYALILIRMGGRGSDQQKWGKNFELAVAPETLQAIARLAEHFPTNHELVNQELARLFIAVDHAPATEKIVNHLSQAATQEEQMAYVTMLADANSGWSERSREKYFGWFLEAARNQGGYSLSGYVNNVRSAVIGKLSDEESSKLAELLAQKPTTVDPYADLAAREFVRKWTMSDLQDLETVDFSTADLENGKKLFTVTACFKCHRVAGNGGIVGPDLTQAGQRFSTYDLLEAIVDPSKSVSDQYQATVFMTLDGNIITGRVANLSNNVYMIQENLITPGRFTNLAADNIDEMRPSTTSLMPEGLLDTLTREEIIDLIGYMKSTGRND
jgi:putative heme-binding domain-containing protein